MTSAHHEAPLRNSPALLLTGLDMKLSGRMCHRKGLVGYEIATVTTRVCTPIFSCLFARLGILYLPPMCSHAPTKFASRISELTSNCKTPDCVLSEACCMYSSCREPVMLRGSNDITVPIRIFVAPTAVGSTERYSSRCQIRVGPLPLVLGQTCENSSWMMRRVRGTLTILCDNQFSALLRVSSVYVPTPGPVQWVLTRHGTDG